MPAPHPDWNGPLDRQLRVVDLAAGRWLLNPGSVGQPRDGDPRASYLVLDTATASIAWHRVAYDIEPVQAAMRAAGLPGFLVSRLSIGL